MFDFDAPGASMSLAYDKALGTVTISGTAVGGVLNGTTVQCNELTCVIDQPK